MKKITLLFSFLMVAFGYSQNTVTVDVDASWNGFMNVFDNPDNPNPGACPGGYCFGSPWGVEALVADIGVTNITLSPNVNTYADNAGDSYWRNNDGAGPDGNKIMEANFFVEPGGSFNGVDLTFTGQVVSNTLDSRYTAVVFIKTIGGTDLNKTIPIPASGEFTISATGAEIASGTVQYGFAVTGLNANPATDWGEIVVTEANLSTAEFEINDVKIFPNPSTNNWNIKTSNQTIEKIEVYDMLGKRVSNMEVQTTEATIDAVNLNSGLYFAKIYTPKGINSVKLIKK